VADAVNLHNSNEQNVALTRQAIDASTPTVLHQHIRNTTNVLQTVIIVTPITLLMKQNYLETCVERPER